jgi:transcription initiation factor IIE alpha subunit
MSAGNIICEGCKRYVPVSDLKYILKKDKRVALCVECRNKTEEAKKTSPIIQRKEEKKKEEISSQSMYFCKRCSYKFKFSGAPGTRLMCPYCGKDDKIIDN